MSFWAEYQRQQQARLQQRAPRRAQRRRCPQCGRLRLINDGRCACFSERMAEARRQVLAREARR